MTVNHPSSTSLRTTLIVQPDIIKSEWVNKTKWGILGSRHRVVMSFNQRSGELQKVTLVAQSAMERLCQWFAKSVGFKTKEPITGEAIALHHNLVPIWEHAFATLGVQDCQTLLSKEVGLATLQISYHIQQLLNKPSLEAMQLGDFLGYFSPKIKEKLQPVKENSASTIVDNQKILLEACRKETLENLERFLNDKGTEKQHPFLPDTLAIYFGKSPEIDRLLVAKENQWGQLKEKTLSADSIAKLNACMDEIIDASLVDDVLKELLTTSQEINPCQKWIQEQCIKLLIQLAPNKSAFQGFLSPRALTSDFFKFQVAAYNTPKTRIQLNDQQQNCLSDINSTIACLALIEGVIAEAREKEKAVLVVTLLETKARLLTASVKLKEALKGIITDTSYSEKSGIIALRQLVTINKLITSVPKTVVWNDVPQGDIAVWTAHAETFISWIEENFSGSTKPTAFALPTSLPRERFEETLAQGFKDSLFASLESNRKNLISPELSEAEKQEIETVLTSLDVFLKAVVSSCEDESPLSKSLQLTINKVLILPPFKLPSEHVQIASMHHSFDKLSIEELGLIIQRLGEIAPTSEEDLAIYKQQLKQLSSYVNAAKLIAASALHTLDIRKLVLSFIASNLDDESNASKMQVEEELSSILDLDFHNLDQISILYLLHIINSSLEKLHTANQKLKLTERIGAAEQKKR